MWPRVALLLLAGAIVAAQGRVDRRLGAFRAQEETLYLWSGDAIRRMAPGFEDVLADIYWLRTVQYFGGQRVYAEGKRFDLLRPLIDITTTLDPRLVIAYKYGAVFLSEPRPVGAGAPRDGIAVLENGVAAMPNEWRIRQDLGFFHFLYLKDAKRAAEILNRAAEIPGAPFWLRTLAAQVAAEGGERASARSMWQAMFDQSEGGALKENARINLKILDALDGREYLQGFVEEFRKTHGRAPASLQELVDTGRIRRVPLDPSGAAYTYDAAAGRVHIAPTSALYRPVYEAR